MHTEASVPFIEMGVIKGKKISKFPIAINNRTFCQQWANLELTWGSSASVVLALFLCCLGDQN